MRGPVSKWSWVAALGLAVAVPGAVPSLSLGQDTKPDQGGGQSGGNRPKLPTPGAAGAGGGSSVPTGPNTPGYPGTAGNASGGSMNAPGAPGAKKTPGAPNGPPQNARPPGGGGGAGGVDGGGGPAGSPGAAGGNDKVVQDFETPVKGAESFLSAVKSKNLEHLSESVALRSRHEAKPQKQGFFGQILDKEIDAEEVDKLAREFDGMKVMDKNIAKSTGRLGVIVGKQVKNETITRTLEMRKEKAGWKVMDYSGQRVIKGFNTGQASGRKKR